MYNNNNLISQNQSGFKGGDSCINQLISITHSILNSLDESLEGSTKLSIINHLTCSTIFPVLTEYITRTCTKSFSICFLSSLVFLRYHKTRSQVIQNIVNFNTKECAQYCTYQILSEARLCQHPNPMTHFFSNLNLFHIIALIHSSNSLNGDETRIVYSTL